MAVDVGIHSFASERYYLRKLEISHHRGVCEIFLLSVFIPVKILRHGAYIGLPVYHIISRFVVRGAYLCGTAFDPIYRQ